MAGREVAWRVFTRWPADIEAYLRARGKCALPAHDPGCAAIASGVPLFATPAAGGRYASDDGSLAVKVFAESAGRDGVGRRSGR